jgi:RimJ/RimL family protein N-acetyltransferase
MLISMQTSHIILRPWHAEDHPSFIAINSDPKVMEFQSRVKSPKQTLLECRHIQRHFKKHGWGLWALGLYNTNTFIGFAGLRFNRSITPDVSCVEFICRLAAEHWGCGYAKEAAQLCFDYGFKTLHLERIVGATPTHHQRARRLMTSLGMIHNSINDFEISKLAAGHPLKKQVIYHIDRAAWLRT